MPRQFHISTEKLYTFFDFLVKTYHVEKEEENHFDGNISLSFFFQSKEMILQNALSKIVFFLFNW